jgi:hypothetical protein
METPVNVMTYEVRKFPNLDEENWFDTNREFVASELEKYKDLFKEEQLNAALRELLAEYLFLHNAIKDVANWRGEFLRYLAHMIETTEHSLERKDNTSDRGRLLILRSILQWF